MKRRSDPLDYAYRLLSIRDRAWSEIEKRMRIKGYSVKEIESVKDRLLELKLINDDEFVVLYIENKRKKLWGPIRIMMELQRLGLHRILIERHLEDVDWETVFDEAVKTFQSRFKDRRLISKLQRQGFPLCWIWEAVKQIDN
jgi:SOS response regulatory protein OraA/RecX